jgi:HPt (histidine-containing phosphotransfer) domain-containing protein
VIGLPSTADTLQAAVRRLLGDSPATPWDDAAAQRTLGLAPAQRRQLRLLLLQELPRQRGHIAEALARGDHARLEAELHRLRSACGFCGAADLLAASIALASEPGSARWRDFDAACAALLADGLASA